MSHEISHGVVPPNNNGSIEVQLLSPLPPQYYSNIVQQTPVTWPPPCTSTQVQLNSTQMRPPRVNEKASKRNASLQDVVRKKWFVDASNPPADTDMRRK